MDDINHFFLQILLVVIALSIMIVLTVMYNIDFEERYEIEYDNFITLNCDEQSNFIKYIKDEHYNLESYVKYHIGEC